jgi:hypothetical protein
MQEKSTNLGGSGSGAANVQSLPVVVDRDAFQAELDKLRVREKAHTQEGDALAAARRRLSMVEVDAKLARSGELDMSATCGPTCLTRRSRR